jgi:hypothetical protein
MKSYIELLWRFDAIDLRLMRHHLHAGHYRRRISLAHHRLEMHPLFFAAVGLEPTQLLKLESRRPIQRSQIGFATAAIRDTKIR